MKYIIVLKHIYEFDDSSGYKQFEDKILGIYSSEKKAKDAIERYFVLSGFNQHPKDCFVVEKWEIDKDTTWKEGFVKSFEANGIREMAKIYDESMGGFNKYSFGSFYIDEVELDKDSGWEEGFVSWGEDDEQ